MEQGWSGQWRGRERQRQNGNIVQVWILNIQLETLLHIQYLRRLQSQSQPHFIFTLFHLLMKRTEGQGWEDRWCSSRSLHLEAGVEYCFEYCWIIPNHRFVVVGFRWWRRRCTRQRSSSGSGTTSSPSARTSSGQRQRNGYQRYAFVFYRIKETDWWIIFWWKIHMPLFL